MPTTVPLYLLYLPFPSESSPRQMRIQTLYSYVQDGPTGDGIHYSVV